MEKEQSIKIQLAGVYGSFEGDFKLLCTPEQIKANYYPTNCAKCGWSGCSCELEGGGQIADTGDYGDCYCPKCGAIADGEEIENVKQN